VEDHDMSDEPNRDPSDADLVERAAAGDEAAFERLVLRHTQAVQRFAERRLPDRLRRRVSVADVVQEARLAAHESLEQFEDRGDGAFRTWLLAIVEHKVRDAIRRHEVSARRSLGRETPRGARADTRHFVGRQATPSQVAIGAETAERAKEVLRRLPSEYREILTLTRTEGLDLRQAAERMGRSYESTRKLVSRALTRFHEELIAGDEDRVER
jgi:RNA polymerase sigma-70 factor (ECF subfamily)